jgi:hypothetical protein
MLRVRYREGGKLWALPYVIFYRTVAHTLNVHVRTSGISSSTSRQMHHRRAGSGST